MKLTDLKRLTQKWQERLKLLDWDITVRWARDDESIDSYGTCAVNPERKEAELALQHPDKWTSEDKADPTSDFEIFVVHELSHCHFSPFQTKKGTAEHVAEENIVTLYARWLIALERKDETLIGRKLSNRAAFNPTPPKSRKPVVKKQSSRTSNINAQDDQAQTSSPAKANVAGSNKEVREGSGLTTKADLQHDAGREK